MAGTVTVSELTRYLANLIGGDHALRNVAVMGEISNAAASLAEMAQSLQKSIAQFEV